MKGPLWAWDGGDVQEVQFLPYIFEGPRYRPGVPDTGHPVVAAAKRCRGFFVSGADKVQHRVGPGRQAERGLAATRK